MYFTCIFKFFNFSFLPVRRVGSRCFSMDFFLLFAKQHVSWTQKFPCSRGAIFCDSKQHSLTLIPDPFCAHVHNASAHPKKAGQGGVDLFRLP